MQQQMGTLYGEELLTNSALNGCQSTEATLPQQWNVAIVCSKAKRNREFCLNPIRSVSSPFHFRRGLKDRWSQYRFPSTIFRQTLLFSQSLFCHLLSSTCTLPVSFQRVLSLSLNFSLSLSYRLGMYHYSPSDHIYQNRRGKRHFQIPSASISQDSCGGLIQSLPDSDIQRYLSHWMPVSYASLQFVFLYSLQHSMQLPFLYNETVPFLCDCTYDDQVQRRLGTQEK